MSTPLVPTNPPTTWALQSLLSGDDSIVTWVDTQGVPWPITGGMAPMPLGTGVQMLDVKGLHAPFKHISQTGAHQDGDTWLDTTYDPTEIDMTVSIFGRDARERRATHRKWLAGWEPRKTGRLTWFTADLGEWWISPRLLKAPTDVLKYGDVPSVTLNWAMICNFPFWVSFDSISTTLVANSSGVLADPAGVAQAGWLQQWNRGDQDGWPIILLQGPGTFTIGDNGGPRRITLPLNAGETARINTLPNQRSAVEINTGANIFKRLSGRFSTPVPAGAVVRIPITVTGSQTGVTSAVASLTPWRRWPE